MPRSSTSIKSECKKLVVDRDLYMRRARSPELELRCVKRTGRWVSIGSPLWPRSDIRVLPSKSYRRMQCLTDWTRLCVPMLGRSRTFSQGERRVQLVLIPMHKVQTLCGLREEPRTEGWREIGKSLLREWRSPSGVRSFRSALNTALAGEFDSFPF